MTHEQIRLERIGLSNVWLARWHLEDEDVWAIVQGRDTPSAMLAMVVAYAGDIPWRVGDPESPVEAMKALTSNSAPLLFEEQDNERSQG